MTYENLQILIEQITAERIEAQRIEILLLKKELQKAWRDEDKRQAFLKSGKFYENHG